MDIAVLGGGISGISAAFLLQELKNRSNLDINIKLFEKNIRWGGSIVTSHEDLFTIEGGPNGFLDSKPHTLELIKMAGLSEQLLPSNELARKRYIMRNGILHRLPENPPAFLKSSLLTFKGKMRILSEIFIKKSELDDESVADFARRRLGEEALDYLIGPMVSGIFAGDPEKMSLRSCFPVIRDLELTYGGLFKGMFKKRSKKSGPAGPGGILTSYKNGLSNLILGLVNKLINVDKYLNTEIYSLKKSGSKYILNSSVGDFIFDKIICTLPSYTLSNILYNLNPDLSIKLGNIVYAPAFVVGFVFKGDDIEDPLDGFGYLIPNKENRKILGALYDSSIFPERCKDGYKMVRVIMGGDKNRWVMEKSDEDLVTMAYNDIKETLKIKSTPVMYKTFRWGKAIPQYYLSHYKIVEAVEQFCNANEGLYIGGNILYGVGLND
ncbi:MAG: protoporphyrinogen oxidase [Deferribacterales bacterium]